VFFIGTTMIAIAMLLYFFRQLDSEERLPAVALGIVLGGAVGNLTDRILYGEVIDFLDVHLWGGYVWPTFNVGDSAIVIGVGLLIIEIFLAGDEENGVPEPSSTSGESPG
jgi:signal peptidase II